jgi:predicted amidohydrolase
MLSQNVVVPGGMEYLESNWITPGDEVVTFSIGDIKFGMSTCYDLRFPEMYRRLADQGVQVILVPAAFTLQTGRDHWELLLRARAVENLCWVAAAAQWGPSPPDHICFGRSIIINPWGIVVAQAQDGISTVVAEIDLGILKKTRMSFPALNHRRKDLFPQ